MVFIKQGEALEISSTDIQSVDSVLADPNIVERFEKIATELKTIAPKAKDFLYFTAVMMHAAEHALLDDTGEIRKNAKGEIVTAYWDKKGDSWKWICSDPKILPFKNANADIFPEEELIRAHKKWIGRPLCVDHKSDSVDHIRGVIIDTYYDLPKKRVVALCALDKKNYPELAFKVESRCQTCVSMGTAVGRAVCFDCGNVARAENDFCVHMRNKTCYGEINLDLKPIELSLVVNGADHKAHIKNVFAAANTIAQYVDQREKLISKLSMHEIVDPDTITEIKKDLQNVLERLDQLSEQAKEVEKIEEAEEQGKLPGEKEEKELEASVEKDDLQKVAKVLGDLHTKVDKLQNIMENFNKNSEENNMSDKKAYFQGGGGANEPTPGRPKYEKEDYQGLRDKQDKQMVGQMDTGPVDGLHPGYDSFPESEEARKKTLQRLAAEKEERAQRRQAVVEMVKAQLELENKKAYFQGGGDANEPAPGKVKYPPEDYKSIRDKEDKQMVGQPPFPEVGAVDGLHPSPSSADQKDELKRKQMLSRASLKGRFIKAANPDGTENKADSQWQVFADDKLILTATVAEITGGKSELHYDSVATKPFGQKILNMLRTENFEKVTSLLKGAQLESAPEAAPPAPPAELLAPETKSEPVLDAGGTGDPKEELPKLLDRAENTLVDIRAAVEALLEEPGDELKEFEEMADLSKGAELSQLCKLQKKVGSAVLVGMKKAATELESSVEELQMAKHIYDNQDKVSTEQFEYAKELTREAMEDTETVLADCYKLMKAFVKYARGTEALMKRAEKEKLELEKTAQDPLAGGKLEFKPEDVLGPEYVAPKGAPYKAPKAPAPKPERPAMPLAMPKGLTPKQQAAWMYAMRGPVELHEWLARAVPQAQKEEGLPAVPKRAPTSKPGGWENYPADDGSDMNDLEMTLQDGTKIKASSEETDQESTVKDASKEVETSTKESRAARREKLAKKSKEFSDMLEKAHPEGGVTTQLDVKPEGNLAKVERDDEQHAAHLEVALAPPRVRKAAEEIQRLVVAGKIDPQNDFDALVAEGLDTEAVKYWKQYYGQAKDGGSEFASELVKEYATKKKAQEEESLRVKIARSYDLAYDMVRRGMLSDDKNAVKAQVDEVMKFDDHGFNSFKNFVEKQPVVKQASMPQVGQLMSTAEVVLPPPVARQSDLSRELDEVFSRTSLKPRLF